MECKESGQTLVDE